MKKAIDYLIKSGEKSLKRFAVDESHQYYNEAFELLTGTIDLSSDSKKRLIHLLVDWALVFYYRGDYKGMNILFSSYEDFADNLTDDGTAGMFFAWLGFALYFRGNVKASYQYLLKAIEIGEKTENQQVIGYACSRLPFTCATLGALDEAIAYGEAEEHINQAIEISKEIGAKSFLGMSYQDLGLLFEARRKNDQARECISEAIQF